MTAMLWHAPEVSRQMVIRNKKQLAGFTLIEVLVSMVILAVGILALISLQINAMRNTQGGYMRAQASLMAYDITDRMRANTPAVTAQNYDIALLAASPVVVTCLGIAADCTSQQLAAFDVEQWRTILANYLPTGTGAIGTVPGAGTTVVTVTVQWVDPLTADPANANLGVETLTITTELPQ